MSSPKEQNCQVPPKFTHTGGHKGRKKSIKTALADGEGEETIREAVSLCATVCAGQKKQRGGHREGEGALCSMASGWSGKDPSWFHVSRTVMAVKRRHARLSVKL